MFNLATFASMKKFEQTYPNKLKQNTTHNLICTQWMHPALLPLLYCSWDLMISPFIYLGIIYTLEEWHRIVNSITAREDVSAQGAPRESHTERLSPKPPRSTANSSVITDQTRPQTDQPCTHSGHWGHSQTRPRLPCPLYPYQYPYSLLKTMA